MYMLTYNYRHHPDTLHTYTYLLTYLGPLLTAGWASMVTRKSFVKNYQFVYVVL